MKKELISILIPAFNEEKNIGKVLTKFDTYKKKYNLEIIVIDDGSNDQTSIVARKYTRKVITLKQNKGKGGAVIEGVKHAKGNFIIQIDADDQFQVKDIPKFINKLRKGFDVVLGTRFDNGLVERGSVSYKNVFGNWLMSQATVFFSGIKVTDIMAGYKGFTRKALHKIDLQTNHFGYEAEVIVKAGKLSLRTTEVPITYKKRVFGKSSVNTVRDGLKVMWTIGKMYFTFPGQPFGRGIVGKRIVRFFEPIWILLLIPFITLALSGFNSSSILQIFIAASFYLAVSFYSQSKTAAFITSGMLLAPSINFLPKFSIFGFYVAILATIFYLFSLRMKGSRVIVISVLTALISGIILNFVIPLSLIFFIFVAILSYLFFRNIEPKVSFLLILSLILLIGSYAGINLVLFHIAISLGTAGVITNIILYLISFKYSSTPLFSLHRIAHLLLLAFGVGYFFRLLL